MTRHTTTTGALFIGVIVAAVVVWALVLGGYGWADMTTPYGWLIPWAFVVIPAGYCIYRLWRWIKGRNESR